MDKTINPDVSVETALLFSTIIKWWCHLFGLHARSLPIRFVCNFLSSSAGFIPCSRFFPAHPLLFPHVFIIQMPGVNNETTQKMVRRGDRYAPVLSAHAGTRTIGSCAEVSRCLLEKGGRESMKTSWIIKLSIFKLHSRFTLSGKSPVSGWFENCSDIGKAPGLPGGDKQDRTADRLNAIGLLCKLTNIYTTI